MIYCEQHPNLSFGCSDTALWLHGKYRIGISTTVCLKTTGQKQSFDSLYGKIVLYYSVWIVFTYDFFNIAAYLIKNRLDLLIGIADVE